jgi:hypothetical protein
MRSIKRKVIDYADCTPGAKIGEDTIQICDGCKKAGLAITSYQKTVVLHAIWFVFNEDGTFEIEDEVHIKPSPVRKESSGSHRWVKSPSALQIPRRNGSIIGFLPMLPTV